MWEADIQLISCAYRRADYFSPSWYDYTGRTADHSIGLRADRMPCHPDDVTQSIKDWVHCLATGQDYVVEFRLRRHDGAWRWYVSYVSYKLTLYLSP